MGFSLAAFDALPWTQGGHPLEQKKVHGERPLGLLRFAPGFADPNWCPRSHILLVLEGSLQLEFERQTVTVQAGQACQIDAGTAHRASNPGAVEALVFIASEIEAGVGSRS